MHLPVRLTILGVLEDDEVVGGEENAPGDRVLVGGCRGVMRKQRGVVRGREAEAR